MTSSLRTVTLLLIGALFAILAIVHVSTSAGTSILLESRLSLGTSQVNSSPSQPILHAFQDSLNYGVDDHHHKTPNGQEQCDSAGCTTAGLITGPSTVLDSRSVVMVANENDRLIPLDPLQTQEPPKATKQVM